MFFNDPRRLRVVRAEVRVPTRVNNPASRQSAGASTYWVEEPDTWDSSMNDDTSTSHHLHTTTTSIVPQRSNSVQELFSSFLHYVTSGGASVIDSVGPHVGELYSLVPGIKMKFPKLGGTLQGVLTGIHVGHMLRDSSRNQPPGSSSENLYVHLDGTVSNQYEPHAQLVQRGNVGDLVAQFEHVAQPAPPSAAAPSSALPSPEAPFVLQSSYEEITPASPKGVAGSQPMSSKVRKPLGAPPPQGFGVPAASMPYYIDPRKVSVEPPASRGPTNVRENTKKVAFELLKVGAGSALGTEAMKAFSIVSDTPGGHPVFAFFNSLFKFVHLLKGVPVPTDGTYIVLGKRKGLVTLVMTAPVYELIVEVAIYLFCFALAGLLVFLAYKLAKATVKAGKVYVSAWLAEGANQKPPR